MDKLLTLFRKNYLFIFVCFLLVFIPLYPKLPLYDILATWVYIRLEDLLIGIAVLLYLWPYIRKKTIPKTSLTLPISLYWIAGLLSLIITVVFIGPTLAEFYPHLSVLHFFRRIEYMMLFFLAYSAISENRRKLNILLYIFAAVVFLVVLYGFGQKFLGFPAFLTMNEEFAKGIPLRLPPTARIPSTFGGHYDLAAYLILAIPIFGSLIFGTKKIWQKVVFFSVSFLSYILLLFTASRISFGVYLVAITVMLFWQKKRILVIPVLIISFVLMNMVSGASERFYKTFRFSNVIVDLSTGQPIGTLDKLVGDKAVVETQEAPDKETLPKGSEFIGIPSAADKKTLKKIEYFTSADLASGSGEIATISGSFLIEKAFVYDISITTRFQGQWPKAVAAFKRNILTGSGFSTLSVAVDGDYLRLLGETGIFGFITYIGIFIFAFYIFLKGHKRLSQYEKAFVIGVFSGIVGIFFNAILIDVFEASKVAFTLWLMLGISLGLLAKVYVPRHNYFQILKKFFTHKIMFYVYIALFVFILFFASFSMYFIGDDFTWIRWAATSRLSDIRDFFISSEGFFYRPIPKTVYLFEYLFFWLKPTAYHFISLTFFAGISIMLYQISLRLKISKAIALIMTFLFASLSIHHENVYWISGQSSLLSAFFMAGALLMFIKFWQDNNKGKHYYLFGYLFTLASMFSYEGTLTLPILIWVLGFAYQKNIRIYDFHHLVLLCMPFYWWARTSASALEPSGDYGINKSKLIVNSIANSTGYFLAILLGSNIVEKWQSLREVFRSKLTYVRYIVLIVLGITIAVTIWTRKRIVKFKELIVWFVCFLISIIPFMGLGNISERYALNASFIMFVLIGLVIKKILEFNNSKIAKLSVILILVTLFIVNIRELKQLEKQWQKASSVVENSLLTFKRQYFPLMNNTLFVVSNVPIKHGRAWIYPTGLNDALWHIFKFNSFAYKIIETPDLKEAFSQDLSRTVYGDTFILVFDDYELKQGVKNVDFVEE